jgi:hypothetical protein
MNRSFLGYTASVLESLHQRVERLEEGLGAPGIPPFSRSALGAPGSSPTAQEIAEYFMERIRKPSGYTWKHGVVEYGSGTGLLAWTLGRRIDEYEVDILVRLEANKKGILSFTWINPAMKFNSGNVVVTTLEQAAAHCKLFNDAYAKQGDGDNGDLRMMNDTLTAMHSRVAKLEAGLGAPGVSQFRS